MFGYINVNGAQLSEENKKIYQSYYCGLCRKLKEFCGKKGQALLNYDMTFLVVLLTGLYEPDTQTGEFTCMMHPMKKRQLRENDIQSYAAQMNVLLAYYNLVDDWKDDHNYTKKTIASMFEKDYQRIKINYPRQTNAIEQYMEKLATYEAEKQTNIDLVAGLTGEMLGEIFAWKQDEWYDELKTLGFYLGKFIYLMDAYEDRDKDEKKDSYNPLRYLDTEGKNLSQIEKKIVYMKNLQAPVKKGDIVGEAQYLLDGKVIGKTDIVAAKSVKKAGLWDYIKHIRKRMIKGDDYSADR